MKNEKHRDFLFNEKHFCSNAYVQNLLKEVLMSFSALPLILMKNVENIIAHKTQKWKAF